MRKIIICFISLLCSIGYSQENVDSIQISLEKEKKEAILDYTKAIEINPNDADAYYNRGISKAKSGDREGAILD